MSRTIARGCVLSLLAVALSATGYAQATWAKKTPWGDPDLQGIWNNGTTTPMERPQAMEGRAELTEEEFAARAKADATRSQGETEEQRKQPGVGAGPTFWYEIGKTSRATSLVVDPPNGRIPALTPQVQQFLAERQKRLMQLPVTSDLWATQGQWVRCISRGVPGTVPTVYNNNYQIIQAPGLVVITLEMIHETRIIPLDNRPRLAKEIGQWRGDARGRWEGQTLIVETTNLHPLSEFNRSAVLMGPGAKVTERFTRVSATEMDYRFTVDAPSAFTAPFTVSIPMTTTGAPERLTEYACVEGDNSVRLAVNGYVSQKLGLVGGPIHIGGNNVGLK